MTLNNEFYNIVKTLPNEGYQIRLNPDSIIYRAHFPEQPITPGVCIIQIATELFQEFHGLKLCLCEIPNAKFLSVIDPRKDDTISVSFSKVTETPEGLKVHVLLTNGERVFTKLSLVYYQK